MAQEDEVDSVEWDMQWATAEFQDQGKYQPLVSSILGYFVLIFSTVVATVANGMAIKYFFTKTNAFFNAFKLVALSDIVICQLSTFYGISLVKERDPLLFENGQFCLGWNMLWKIVVRFSLHLVAIQSTLRTIKICQPLRPLSNSNRALRVAVSLDLIVITGVAVVGQTRWKPIFTKSWASCIEAITTVLADEDPISLQRNKARALILFYAVLPFPVIFACCALCSFQIVKRKFRSTNRRARLLTHSIISLLAFSLTGFVLNMASFATLVIRSSFYEELKKDDKMKIWFLLYGNIICRQINITLNSVLNPFIFLWRMEEFRSNVRASVTLFYETFSRHFSTSRTALNIQIEPGGERADIGRPQDNIQNISLRRLQQQENLPNDLIFSNHDNLNEKRQQQGLPNDLIFSNHDDLNEKRQPEPDKTRTNSNDLNRPPDITGDSLEMYQDPRTEMEVSCRAMVTEPEFETTVIVHRNANSHVDHDDPVSKQKLSDFGATGECECCFLETNIVENLAIKELPSYGSSSSS